MAEVCCIDWHLHVMREDRWRDAWEPAAERALAFGARRWSLTRSVDDPLHFRQTMVFDRREDFDRYWYSDEVAAVREEIMNLYNKPLVISWHTLVASSDEPVEAVQAAKTEPG